MGGATSCGNSGEQVTLRSREKPDENQAQKGKASPFIFISVSHAVTLRTSAAVTLNSRSVFEMLLKWCLRCREPHFHAQCNCQTVWSIKILLKCSVGSQNASVSHMEMTETKKEGSRVKCLFFVHFCLLELSCVTTTTS